MLLTQLWHCPGCHLSHDCQGQPRQGGGGRPYAQDGPRRVHCTVPLPVPFQSLSRPLLTLPPLLDACGRQLGSTAEDI
jgi:hypothetical protein